jgi:hypothetical protein
MGTFTSLGTVEEYPDRQIIRELLEVMVVSGGNINKRARRNLVATFAIKEETTTACDYVDFIAQMRF